LSECDCEVGDTTGERGDSTQGCGTSWKLGGSISHNACCFHLDWSSTSMPELITPTNTAVTAVVEVGRNLWWINC